MKNKILLLTCIVLLSLNGCSQKHNQNLINTIAGFLETCNSETKYQVYDIGNDGIIEILTANNDSHADMVTIYSIDNKDNKIKELGSFGGFGDILLSIDKGYVISSYLGQGINETYIYEISNSSSKLITSLWTNDGTLSDKYEYRIDDNLVSEEDYSQVISKYFSEDIMHAGYDNFTNIADHKTNISNISNMLN